MHGRQPLTWPSQKLAGYAHWFNGAAADVARVKLKDLEKYNHFSDNPPRTKLTTNAVYEQVARYDDPNDRRGHLYGAILATVRAYQRNSKAGRGQLDYCVHYIGDLSNPLHNMEFNDFNKTRHDTNDAVVDLGILEHLERIKLSDVRIATEDDLAREIVRIAQDAMALGYRMQAEARNMTPEEAYGQIGKSASLLRAVLVYLHVPAKVTFGQSCCPIRIKGVARFSGNPSDFWPCRLFGSEYDLFVMKEASCPFDPPFKVRPFHLFGNLFEKLRDRQVLRTLFQALAALHTLGGERGRSIGYEPGHPRGIEGFHPLLVTEHVHFIVKLEAPRDQHIG